MPKVEREKVLVAEDLARALKTEGGELASGRQLQSIFLVLPELADDSPDWLAALDRVQISPNKGDLSLLLKSLRGAATGDLLRVGRGASGIAARIENENPDAIPVSLARFRRKAADLGERFFVDINEANTYLDKGILHTPPIQSLYEYFAVGVENLGLPSEVLSDGLNGHEAWPFLATGLAYQGTPGPIFFIAKQAKVSEQGQLLARLKAASDLSSFLKERLRLYKPMLQMVIAGPLEVSSKLMKELGAEFQQRLELREELPGRIEKRFARLSTPTESAEQILKRLEEEEFLSDLLLLLAQEPARFGRASVPTLRDLIDAVTEREELGALLELLQLDPSSPICTNVRKAIRALDFSLHFGTGRAAKTVPVTDD